MRAGRYVLVYKTGESHTRNARNARGQRESGGFSSAHLGDKLFQGFAAGTVLWSLAIVSLVPSTPRF